MKIAIIAGNARRKYFNPGPDTEIWGLNARRFEWVPKWHRMFNLHMFSDLQRDWPHGLEKERGWSAANARVPFYVCDAWPDGWLKNEHLFPRDDLAKQIRGDYHATSIDWMVAFALHIGVAEIALHGITLNMAHGEPISGRACLEYWCGRAEGAGIKVTTMPDCDIFRQYHLVVSNTVYGYDDVRIIEDRTGDDLEIVRP